jgi:hypothetical protein
VTLHKLLCPPHRHAAMLNFQFLRLASAGGDERITWARDKLLTQQDDGSAAAISNEKMKASAESLRAGGSLIGTITACSLSTEFSMSGQRYQSHRLEALARQKFTISLNSVVGGGVAVGPMLSAAPTTASSSEDDFYKTNVPHLPTSWPITIPVLVRDPTVMPSKWQHGMGDELILAFWKMVDFTKSVVKGSRRFTRPPWRRHVGQPRTSSSRCSMQSRMIRCETAV